MRIFCSVRAGLAAGLFLLAGGAEFALGGGVKSPVKSDETVLFYTTAAWPGKEPGAWETEVHGIIYEEESRPLAALGLRKLLGIDTGRLNPFERALMQDRLKLFLADNERGKELPVQLGTELHRLSQSAPNGHFRHPVTFRAPAPKPLPVQAILREGDQRRFSGVILPMEDTDAPMVVSDVDDTIKVTEVLNRPEALANTFCRPFTPVPGMPELYRRWAREGGAFHYVSGSPWQLYVPLECFVKEQKFPEGAWHLKHLRLADPETVTAFLGPQLEYKLSAIRPLFQRWQKRRFVLVGDTGEQDPEIYARLALEHPDRVQNIFLRNVTGDTRQAPRLLNAFRGVPETKWSLFTKTEELPHSLRRR